MPINLGAMRVYKNLCIKKWPKIVKKWGPENSEPHDQYTFEYRKPYISIEPDLFGISSLTGSLLLRIALKNDLLGTPNKIENIV